MRWAVRRCQTHAALPKFGCSEATPVGDMLEFELLEPVTRAVVSRCSLHTLSRRDNSLFALRVEIDAVHITLDLVKGDVVETLETRSSNGPDPVVGY